MTSLTTVLATVPMLFLVSTQLAQFVLPLMVGVLVGTYSSIFLCSPLYYEFNKGEEKSKYLAQQKARKRIEEKKKRNESKGDAKKKTEDKKSRKKRKK